MEMSVQLMLVLVAVSITPALVSTTKIEAVEFFEVTATTPTISSSVMVFSSTSDALSSSTVPPLTTQVTSSTPARPVSTSHSMPLPSSTSSSSSSMMTPSSSSSMTTGLMSSSPNIQPSTSHAFPSSSNIQPSSPDVHPSSSNVQPSSPDVQPSSAVPHSHTPVPSHCTQVESSSDCSDCMRKLYITVGTTIPATILLTMLAMIPLCWCCQKTKKKGTYIRMAPTVYFDEDDN